MLKAILAGTTALAIAGSSLVYAQQRSGRFEGRGQPNIEDMRAFAEARLGALKAGLMLTPEQERNWPAFEQAARELAKQRLDRVNALRATRGEQRRDRDSSDPSERLRRRATVMSETGAVLKKLADATEPLYKSLDDGQKRRFAMLSRLGGRDGRGGRELRGREGNGRGFGGRGGDEFHGRNGGDEFRGRDGGRRGFEGGSRRSEFGPGRFERDRGQDSERRSQRGNDRREREGSQSSEENL